ncbi:MAG: DNA repair protein RecO [Acidisphaera sp.]|nr:DNA repair protein RecO [Acidisphaera sp.]
MDWNAPAIILEAAAYGEGDALASVLTEEHGRHRGLARGGASRRHAAVWQAGNVANVRWVGRLAEQLGSFSAELLHPAAALVMDDPLRLSLLAAACAVTVGALPEREPHPRVFVGLMQLIAVLETPDAPKTLVRWEVGLLAELGYGLDLSRCAVTGRTENLAFVSPKTGRAVSEQAAGDWKPRLLRLPHFLAGEAPAGPADWRDGLRLTGHFLARDAFGHQHRPLPPARLLLYDRVADLARADET